MACRVRRHGNVLLVPSAGYPADEPAAGEPTAYPSSPAAAEAPNGLVDDLNGFGKAYQRGNLYTESGTPAYYGNDAKRAVRSTTAPVTSFIRRITISLVCGVQLFFTGVTVAPHHIYASADGTAFAKRRRTSIRRANLSAIGSFTSTRGVAPGRDPY